MNNKYEIIYNSLSAKLKKIENNISTKINNFSKTFISNAIDSQLNKKIAKIKVDLMNGKVNFENAYKTYMDFASKVINTTILELNKFLEDFNFEATKALENHQKQFELIKDKSQLKLDYEKLYNALYAKIVNNFVNQENNMFIYAQNLYNSIDFKELDFKLYLMKNPDMISIIKQSKSMTSFEYNKTVFNRTQINKIINEIENTKEKVMQ